jgi:hypothetical protein
MASVSVHIDDITTLAVDVIGNAVNEQQGDSATHYMND